MRRLIPLAVMLLMAAGAVAQTSLIFDTVYVRRWTDQNRTYTEVRAAGDSWRLAPWWAIQAYVDTLGGGAVDYSLVFMHDSAGRDAAYRLGCLTIMGAECYANDNNAVALGYQDTASGAYSAIGGGRQNVTTGSMAVVGGGDANSATGDYSFIGGGSQNSADGDYSAVGAGLTNNAAGRSSFVGAGEAVAASGYCSMAGGLGPFAVTDTAHFGWSGTVSIDTPGVRGTEKLFIKGNALVADTAFKGDAVPESALATVQFVRDSGGGGGGLDPAYADTIQMARDTANAALDSADAAYTLAGAALDTANLARDTANAALDTATAALRATEDLLDTLQATRDTLAIVRDTANQALADAATALDTARAALAGIDSSFKWVNASESLTCAKFARVTDSVISAQFIGKLLGDVDGNCSGNANTASDAALLQGKDTTALKTVDTLTATAATITRLHGVTSFDSLGGGTAVEATRFRGAFIGNVTGDCSGNAGTATFSDSGTAAYRAYKLPDSVGTSHLANVLQTARLRVPAIYGVTAFDSIGGGTVVQATRLRGALTGNVIGTADSAVGCYRVGGKVPTATPGASAIPISDASGYLDGWQSPSFVLATYASALPCTSAVYKLIPYGTEVKDNLNEFSSGVFTAAANGYYTISAGASTASTAWSAGHLTLLYLYIDGAAKYLLNTDATRWAGTYVAYPRGSISVYLAAGQTADVRFYQNSGGVVNTGTSAVANFISIARTR